MKASEFLEKFRRPNFTCDICGREVFGGERICRRCDEALPRIGEKRCPICGRAQQVEGICLECKQTRPLFETARSLFRHEGEASRLVLRYKNGEKYLSRTILELLLPRLEEFPEANAIAFVPMTARAERARGYNQSRLLAEGLAQKSGLPLLSAAEKVRETDEQKSLGRRGRQKNLEGCFKITEKKAVEGKTILLIDDTLTTGATANELTKQFLAAKAKKVFVLTVTSVGDPASADPARKRPGSD